ncbi:rho guanine nucleotide exchange factor 28-like [Aplochiton taeniatus]
MDSDSDSPFNYSWPSFPKMRIRRKTSKQEKSQSIRGSKAPCSTQAAASRLSAMIHGKDQVYANAMLVHQVNDSDLKYHSPKEEVEEEYPVPQMSNPQWDSFPGSPTGSDDHLQDSHRSHPSNGERGTLGSNIGHHRQQSSSASLSSDSPSSPPASPFRSTEGGLRHLAQPHLCGSPCFSHRGSSLPEETCTLSPSLEAVECDSGEDDILGHSYPAYRSSSPCKRPVPQYSLGSEERDSFDNSPDLSRTHSDSTHPSTKAPGEAEARLRSYSYTSPNKARPLLNRDTAISDLSEEQRTLSFTESPREKRVLGFRKRAQSAEEEGSPSLQHLTLSEFLKEIEDEEWDKYIIPSKVESEKYKVSRTFSFLKSRMSSTRNKTKVKGKEIKEVKEKTGSTSGHQFVPVSPSGPCACVACDKPIPGRELWQCSNCSLSVHKGCRDSAAACGKKPPEKNLVTIKNKSSSLPQNTALLEGSPTSLSSPSSSSSSHLIMLRDRRDTAAPPAKSLSVTTDRRLSDGVGMDSEATCCVTEEGSQVTPTSQSTDPPNTEAEPVDAPLLSDLSAELLGFEAESWSLVITPEFCRQQDKRTIKRQDVIYELMQTELHHIQTLTVMSEVFRRGMLEELQLDWDCVARIFPCLDPLLLFHRNLFGALQERRQASAQPDNRRNYLLHRIGDVLLQQFSAENAVKMKKVYGEFCSHHTEAVNVFKELQQQNKKFQVFVKQQSIKTLVRRREVPEFILLVTQRITKYPVLLERILQYTPEDSNEHMELSQALAQIRDIIAAVDLSVREYDKDQELQEVLSRLENKSLAKRKNGKVFRKQDLHSHQRALQHKGLVYWKTATGRLKDTLALLLTDMLVFLQEKDQRFIFAAVDQKPPVIPLQKLIVREVANEERGMFLISASSAGPEMYEVHTTTREERNAWMRHIRQAVESCPEEEEEEDRSAESEEVRRVAEARVQKINKYQETLLGQDQHICSSLEEKLQMYAELTKLTLHSPEPLPQRHLLVHPDSDTETTLQATSLLAAALSEAEKLISTLHAQEAFYAPSDSSPVRGPECFSYNSHGSIQESSSEPDYLSTLSVSSSSLVSDSEWPDGLVWQSFTELRRGDSTGAQLKIAESVQSLTQLLYSLQAAVSLQDSCYEVQKLLLQEGDQPLPRSSNSLLGNSEPEKQRCLTRKREEFEKKSVEKRKEEVVEIQKLQAKLKQEQQRWDRECQARQKQQGELESLLEHREQQCHLEAERLRCEREELEAQLLEYQQSLERLREGQRTVEREREKIEAQHRLLASWRHNRQRSLPVMIPLGGYQVSSHSRSGSLDGNGSMYLNKEALLHSLRKNPLRPHNNHHQGLQAGFRTSQDSPVHSPSQTSGVSLSPSLYNSLNTLLTQAHVKAVPDPLANTQYQYHSQPGPTSGPDSPFSRDFPTRHQGINNNFSPPLDRLSLGHLRPGPPGLGQCDYNASASLSPLLTRQAYLTLDGQSGEDRGEENIVYL